MKEKIHPDDFSVVVEVIILIIYADIYTKHVRQLTRRYPWLDTRILLV